MRNVLHRLEMDVFSGIGKVPIEEVTHRDLIDVFRKIEARGAHEVAKRNKAVNRLRFPRHSQAVQISLFKIDWRQSFVEAVPALRIVEHLDIVKDVLSCFVTGDVGFSANAFPLEQLEEAFGHGVIMAVPAPAH